MSKEEFTCQINENEFDKLKTEAEKFDEKWTDISIRSYDTKWMPETVKEISIAMKKGLPPSVVDDLVLQTEKMLENFNDDLNEIIIEFKKTRVNLLNKIYTITEKYIDHLIHQV
jgi:hypothetical protein